MGLLSFAIEYIVIKTKEMEGKRSEKSIRNYGLVSQ